MSSVKMGDRVGKDIVREYTDIVSGKVEMNGIVWDIVYALKCFIF